MRGRRGRAKEEEEEEGRRCRRTPVAPVAVFASGWRGRERGGKNLEEESGAVVYIWFSGFVREAEDNGEKLTRNKRIGRVREAASSDLDRRMRDRTAREI